jgi:hypothetical protein
MTTDSDGSGHPPNQRVLGSSPSGSTNFPPFVYKGFPNPSAATPETVKRAVIPKVIPPSHRESCLCRSVDIAQNDERVLAVNGAPTDN